jgi:7-cyano-7-deazaguanine synthase in queuosine biosynthesis
MIKKKTAKLPVTKEQFVEALVNTAQRNALKDMQKGFLCMFSGGLDSTALLHSLLTNPEYQRFTVFVHHIHFINREQRAEAEKQSVRNIINYYKDRDDVREFDYKESVFDTSSMDQSWSPRFSYDMDVTCFLAAQICLAKPTIKYVGIAVPKDDFVEGNEGTLARIKHAPDVFNAGLYSYPNNVPRPQIIYPTQSLMKKELWASLPQEVREMIWCCRTPVWKDGKPKPCGRCHTCVQMKKSGIVHPS